MIYHHTVINCLSFPFVLYIFRNTISSFLCPSFSLSIKPIDLKIFMVYLAHACAHCTHTALLVLWWLLGCIAAHKCKWFFAYITVQGEYLWSCSLWSKIIWTRTEHKSHDISNSDQNNRWTQSAKDVRVLSSEQSQLWDEMRWGLSGLYAGASWKPWRMRAASIDVVTWSIRWTHPGWDGAHDL